MTVTAWDGQVGSGAPVPVNLYVGPDVRLVSGRKSQFVDAAGQVVTVQLSGPGSGDIFFDHSGPGNPSGIVLNGTTEKSSLTITAKRSAMVTITGQIVVNGALKTLNAPSAAILAGVRFNGGGVAKLVLGDALGSQSLVIGAWSNSKTGASLTFGDVSDLKIQSAMALSSLYAAQWLDGDDQADIVAPRLDKLKVKGDFQADLNLTGNPTTPRTLNSAYVGGNLADSLWDLAGNLTGLTVVGTADHSRLCTGGSMGTLSLGATISSDFLAGMDDTIQRCPQSGQDFQNVLATIKSVTIKGLPAYRRAVSPPRFVVDSHFAAYTLGSVSLLNVDSTDPGGLYAFNAGTLKEVKSVRSSDWAGKALSWSWHPASRCRCSASQSST